MVGLPGRDKRLPAFAELRLNCGGLLQSTGIRTDNGPRIAAFVVEPAKGRLK